MAESSVPWTDGLTDGGPYSDSAWQAVWKRLFANAIANAGILKGARSEFLTTGVTSPVTVQAGSAIVDGAFYDSTASVAVTVPTPAVSTRIDRIVLQKSWAAGTVRIARIAGAEGGGAPALTQSAGVTWEIPLFQIAITTGGAISYNADERVFAQIPSETTIPVIPGGRLTLTTAVPVTTSDVLAASTVYYTPWRSNRIPVFVNSVLRVIEFAEISLSIGALAADTLYDIFAYVDAQGTLTLEALAWSSSGAGTSARATAIASQNGVRVKSGDISRTFLGTIRTTGTLGQTEDSIARRYVANAFNLVPRHTRATIEANTWSYTTNTWRAANADSTDGSGRFGVVIALQEGVLLEAEVTAQVQVTYSSGAARASAGIGINSTSANSATPKTNAVQSSAGDSLQIPLIAKYKGYLPVGYNQVQRLEIGSLAAAGTITWYGNNTDTNEYEPNSGLTGVILA